MAVYIYNIMITARKGKYGEYKNKFFHFTNQQEAKKAFNNLKKELKVITGKEPDILLDDRPYVAYISEDYYYNIDFSKTLVTISSDTNINFQFKSKKNED